MSSRPEIIAGRLPPRPVACLPPRGRAKGAGGAGRERPAPPARTLGDGTPASVRPRAGATEGRLRGPQSPVEGAYQLVETGMPSLYPEALWTPMTARSANDGRSRAPA
jgi:hypothetical protein